MKRKSVRNLAATAIAVLIGCGANAASAQQCDVFTDTLASANYCNAVQWLKNRGITTGCHAQGQPARYCPGDVVSRAAMALFMNRLGLALTPRLVGFQQGMGTGNVIAAGSFLTFCQTQASALPAVNYPQQVRARGTISANLSGSAVGMALYLSLNAGTFSNMNSTELLINPGGEEVLHWSSNVVSVPPGNSISVAISLLNRGAGTLTLANNGRCAIEVEAYSANPTSAPFDEQ